MRKSNYKQLIILLILLQSECIAQQRDPDRFLRECDCQRMEKYLIELAEEEFGCNNHTNHFCWNIETNLSCEKKIERYNVLTYENFILLHSLTQADQIEFISNGDFEKVDGICSKEVPESEKQYCYDDEGWSLCCTGGLKQYCEAEEEKLWGTDPVHIFLHGLCGVLWVFFIGYAVLSGW